MSDQFLFAPLPAIHVEKESPYLECSTSGYGPVDHFSGSFTPLNRQFWKAGDYEVQKSTTGQASQNVQNRLCVNPKFLHSNATSHKWAFGAISELLDNAFDEIRNGATFVKVDDITNPRDGSSALLIQDNGGGMDPESLRCCMSFGFSDKQSSSAIGQYGNGFKTSTMRLGADVIVFSCCIKEKSMTQSVGILSYTFLRQEGFNDVVIPAVDYSFDSSSGVFNKLLRHGQNHFFSNLSVLLKWSPFLTEDDLLENFNEIGHHGTKIIIYNMWHNDMGDMELDFESDQQDILISGAPKKIKPSNTYKMLAQNHIANRFSYSLRAYASILYLHTPEHFRIILRGTEVVRQNIARDLKFCECIKYKPQVGGKIEGEVITTIGFLKEAPFINVHGFNIYHRNRLIMPFYPVASVSGSRGRGVVGVLEANFIKPTHDKQGFERSAVYQKLISRLREMTYEYWEFHCHLIGYAHKYSAVTPPDPSLNVVPQPLRVLDMDIERIPTDTEFSPCKMSTFFSHPLPDTSAVALFPAARTSSAGQFSTQQDANPIQGTMRKREREEIVAETPVKALALYNTGKGAGEQTNYQQQLGNSFSKQLVQDKISVMQENMKLRKECLELEKTQKELLLKAQKLTLEIEGVKEQAKKVFEEHVIMDGIKMQFETPH